MPMMHDLHGPAEQHGAEAGLSHDARLHVDNAQWRSGEIMGPNVLTALSS